MSERLKRDRSEGPDPELEELKASIRDVGLSNPIRVEPREDGKFELVQGMRRLSAYRALLLETGDETYARIPAGLMSRADAVASYRRMVDENLVRKDISFAEMATLARGYAQDPAHDCPDVDKAVGELFKSASYTKRSYIRAFASLLCQLEPFLAHPNAIPRNLGVELKRRMDADETLVDQIRSDLLDMTQRTAEDEAAILRRHAGRSAKESTRQTPGEPAAAKPRTAKTTFQVRSAKGVAKCSASNGRIDLRFDLDFTRIDRSRLERAIEDLLIRLQDDQP
ncbi:MAG: ParB N-terminal domain-containing protein [Pseudomonadota bacterium]